jgi:hypothetical protein
MWFVCMFWVGRAAPHSCEFEINKQLNKLPLILLCTIRIDESLFDCHVLPQQGRNEATRSGTGVPDPFGISLE